MRGPLVIHFASALFWDGSHLDTGGFPADLITGRLTLVGGQKMGSAAAGFRRSSTGHDAVSQVAQRHPRDGVLSDVG